MNKKQFTFYPCKGFKPYLTHECKCIVVTNNKMKCGEPRPIETAESRELNIINNKLDKIIELLEGRRELKPGLCNTCQLKGMESACKHCINYNK